MTFIREREGYLTASERARERETRNVFRHAEFVVVTKKLEECEFFVAEAKCVEEEAISVLPVLLSFSFLRGWVIAQSPSPSSAGG